MSSSNKNRSSNGNKRQRKAKENGSTKPPPTTKATTTTVSSESPLSSPVKVVTLPSTAPPQDPIGLQSPQLLKDILYPLTPEEFMTKYFRRQAVHISTQQQEDVAEKSTDNNEQKKAAKKNKSNKNKPSTTGEETITNRYRPIIEEAMFHLNAKELVHETSSDSVFVWLPIKDINDAEHESKKEHSSRKHKHKHTHPSNKDSNPLIQSVEISEPETALALHQSGGHSLYCRAPPAVEQVLVAKLLRDTGLGCGQYDPSGESVTCMARGEVEMFITAKAGGITDWHYDFQENFTLQLSGVKRWTLQQGTVSDPLRACTPHYRAPEVVESQLKVAQMSNPVFTFDQPVTKEDQDQTIDITDEESFYAYNAKGHPESVTLRPGDAFYFPAGMWHKIEVLEPGVSINISVMATNYATVTCQALQHYLLERDEWRQVITHNPNIAGTQFNALEQLKGLLKDLPGIIEEFQRDHGGAQAILPPALLQPPIFHMTNDEEEDDGSCSEEGDKKPAAKKLKRGTLEEEDDELEEEDEEGEEVEMEDGAVGERDEDGNGSSGDKVIDAFEFEYPSGYNAPCEIVTNATADLLKTLETHKFIVNPLASLIRMDQLNKFYAEHNLKKNASQTDDTSLFVLNVNYAGVESHESAVRVILRDHPDARLLNDIWMYSNNYTNEAYIGGAHLASQICPSLVHCLLYYGFFILSPR